MQQLDNFDFGANWDSVLSFFDKEEMQEVMTKAMKKIRRKIKDFEKKHQIEESLIRGLIPNITKTMPAQYCVYPLMTESNLEFHEYWYSAKYCYGRYQLDEQIRNDNMSDLWNRYNACILDSNTGLTKYNKTVSKLYKLEDAIIDELSNISIQKSLIFSYIPFGFENIWAQTFSIMLAKLMFPQEEWLVVKNIQTKINTVINKNGTKIFDICEWAKKGKLLDHLYGSCVKLPGAENGQGDEYDDFKIAYSRYVECDGEGNILI
jgi:hypothetical protein